MQKLLTVIGVIIALCTTACTQNKTQNQTESSMKTPESKTLVVYFSATGTTKNVAEKLAKITGADLLEIEPEVPYTSADLDWNVKTSRSSVEMADTTTRPAIKVPTKKAYDYDIIYIGFPIWWDLAPTVVNTYIDGAGLNGKKVIPFATSGGSTIENSVTQLRKSYPEINWTDGQLLNNATEDQLKKFVESSK